MPEQTYEQLSLTVEDGPDQTREVKINIIDGSPEVKATIEKASELISRKEKDEAWSLLSVLLEKNQIQMIQV